LWNIIGDNRLYFPEYIYQLMRGISLMEGIGRQLYPDLNIMESIKPFARRIMMERLSPEAIFKKGKHKVESFAAMSKNSLKICVLLCVCFGQEILHSTIV
jgi:ubiquinone biosynthesis protein